MNFLSFQHITLCLCMYLDCWLSRFFSKSCCLWVASVLSGVAPMVKYPPGQIHIIIMVIIVVNMSIRYEVNRWSVLCIMRCCTYIWLLLCSFSRFFSDIYIFLFLILLRMRTKNYTNYYYYHYCYMYTAYSSMRCDWKFLIVCCARAKHMIIIIERQRLLVLQSSRRSQVP